MKMHVYGQLAVGFIVVVTVLMMGALPSYAWTGGGGSWHGGGFHGGGFHHGGFHHFRHGFHHQPSVFSHRPCCFGPRAFVGVGVGLPLVYPYAYPYSYPVYSSPVVAESAQPVYVQPGQQYWYYCRDSQAYYPYVKECPGGWIKVVPQPS